MRYEVSDLVKSRTNIAVRDSAPLEEHKRATNEMDNDMMCEAVNCFEKATNTIEVEAGNHRTISLSLCNDCVCKFSDK
jgi:hypothetical protein